MITTTTNHHETLVPFLPAIGSAVTVLVCWLKLRQEQNQTKPPTTPTHENQNQDT